MISLLKMLSPHYVYAQSTWSGTCVSDGVATITGFECLYKNVLQVIVNIAGLVFFAMLIVGGFKYLTSGGDSKKVAAASSTLTMAVIGIIGVIASWLILLFIKNFTGIDVTQFTIPTN
jgi:hypothetical protein